MEFALLYTVGAIVVYFASDWVLDRIERTRGARFKYRNLVFFVIIFALALGYMYLVNPAPAPSPEQ